MNNNVKQADNGHGRFYFWCFLLIFLSLGIERTDYLVNNVPVTQYIDELLAIAFLPCFLWKSKRILAGVHKLDILMFVGLAIFEITGLAGVAVYHYQPLSTSLKDAFLAIKFFIAFVGFTALFMGFSGYKAFYKRLWWAINVLTVALGILTVLDYALDLFYTEIRWGMPAIRLFYAHYTDLVSISAALSAMYLRYYEEKGKKTWPGLFILFIILFSTRRAKGFAVIPVTICIIILLLRKRRIQLFEKVLLSISAGIAVITCVGQVWFYFFYMELESARSVLFTAGPWLAKQYFPIGTGWGTFGSAASADPYSPVYGLYGMNVVWGLSPGYNKFIADNYWPMVLGQCGFFGCAALVMVLAIMAWRIIQVKRVSPAICSSLCVSFCYLLLSSTSEAVFSSYVAIPHALWMGFLVAEYMYWVKKQRE